MKTNQIKLLFKLILLCSSLVLQSYAQAEIKVTYYVPDASGSPIAATDEQGEVLWRKHYKPFGEEIEQDVASKDNHIGYTGHVHDRSTGLTYMRARYYDPVVGRFMAMDPAAVDPSDPRTFNRYAYAANNPYKFIDPDGREFLAWQAANRRDGDTSRASFRMVGMGGVSAALSPYAVAATAPSVPVAAAEVLMPTATIVARNLDTVAGVASVISAYSGSPSPHPDLPANSPLDPKTHVEQVKANINKPKTKSIISKVVSVVLTTAFALESSKDTSPTEVK